MKKLTILISIILLTSCGSVKKSSTETEIKTESENSTEIYATKFSNSFTLEPVDLTKPILFLIIFILSLFFFPMSKFNFISKK